MTSRHTTARARSRPLQPASVGRALALALFFLLLGSQLQASSLDCFPGFQSASLITRQVAHGTVAHGDLDGDGLTDLFIKGSDAWSVLNRGNETFERHLVPRPDSKPVTILIEDVNRDGFGDLVTLNPRAVYFGSGNGSFGEEVLSGIAASLTRFRGEGIVSLRTERERIVLERVDRNGTFSEVGSIPYLAASRVSPSRLFAGDFDGDGLTDVAFGVESDQILGIAWNKGGFQFDLASLSTKSVQTFLGAADVDSDGADEIVALHQGKLLLIDAEGRQLNRQVLSVADRVSGVETKFGGAEDLDGDGLRDLVFSSKVGVLVLWNDAVDPFRDGELLAIPGAGVSPLFLDDSYRIDEVGLVDLNHDGFIDIVPTEVTSAGLHVVWGRHGTREFKSGHIISGFLSPNANALAGADLNHDGFVDLVRSLQYYDSHGAFQGPAVGAGADVWLGDGSGNFRRIYEHRLDYADHHYYNRVAVLDLTGDGIEDLVISSTDGYVIFTEILKGHGDGTFSPSNIRMDGMLLLGSGALGPGGAPGLLLKAGNSIVVGWLESQTLVKQLVIELGPEAWAARAIMIDTDGDGRDEIMFDGLSYGSVHLLRREQSEWRVAHQFQISTDMHTAEVLDFDDDGRRDLVLGGMGQMYLYRNTGGGFVWHDALEPWGYRSVGVITVDMNGDGRKDLVTVSSDDSPSTAIYSLAVRLNLGNGTIASVSTLDIPLLPGLPLPSASKSASSGGSVITGADAVLMLDVDGDERLDVVTASGAVLRGECSDETALRASALPRNPRENQIVKILIEYLGLWGRMTVLQNGAPLCSYEPMYPLAHYSCETLPLSAGIHRFEIRAENEAGTLSRSIEINVLPQSPRRRSVTRGH